MILNLKNWWHFLTFALALVETENSKIYHFVDRLVCLVLILLISIVTTEWAFSAMMLIKIRLCNKMEDTFLAYCLIVYIEEEIAKNIGTTILIEDFINVTEWMAQLRWRPKLVKIYDFYFLSMFMCLSYGYTIGYFIKD